VTTDFMTWVKICGMTNLEDALTAVEAGADAVGFVFYEKSPRRIGVDAAREIVAKLPQNVESVGVFAGESVARAGEIGSRVGFDALQVYPLSWNKDGAGENAPATSTLRPKKIYLAFPMAKFVGQEHAVNVDVESREGVLVALLLDSGGARQPGGTGVQFDWNQAAPAVAALSRIRNVVIAGGLTPGNVGEAIGILQPWGVDVVSGVEASPGRKDPEKVRAFVNAVRALDRKTS
jgi:phosphoribosylanthranilate isomerase